MIVYTTCRDCGGLLHTTDRDTVHPTCTPKPTLAERLAAEVVAAVEAGHRAAEMLAQEELDAIEARAPRLSEAALRYAGWGWPVFPLKPCSKQPATAHGFKDATTDPTRIQAWWRRHPDSNIGLPTGLAFDVIDFDIPDGIGTLQQICGTDRAVHGWVTTASAGTHLYIRPTGLGNMARWMAGTDYRGVGGYVVAPPSRLDRRGAAWTWRHTPSPAITGKGDTNGVDL